MKILNTEINGLMVIEPKIFEDDRGFFFESYQKNRYEDFGITSNFVQDNISYSKKNTLRGLHFQIDNPQAKLVQVISGEIYDVALDLRVNSPHFGEWFGVVLSGSNKKQLFIPEGFAHGFCVTSDTATFSYKCSDIYNPTDEGGIIWSDPEININWPVTNPVLSQKDNIYKQLSQLESHELPK
ncbi:MAG: dTDP-4-dehydrorhamnose 3,5-epimerase [Desulfobacterales bacterium]|nr:dTDP-4-dehydrorhamnose 3,5-epimerase [Desulfobacterales bacterium]MCP4161905.1 dTDP-4-dehydrorhamnose 3,5-epimerase [Deltaproteobacteria bacterium]